MRSPGELQLRQAVDTNRSEGKDDRLEEGAMTDGGLFPPVSVIASRQRQIDTLVTLAGWIGRRMRVTTVRTAPDVTRCDLTVKR